MTITPALGAEPALREHVAEEVRALLARKRISGVTLARRIGKSHTYVWRRLSGETAFDLDDLERIAGVLSVHVTALIPKPLDLPYGQAPSRPRDNRPPNAPNGHSTKPIQPDISRRPVRCRTATPPTPSDTRRYGNGRMIPTLRSVA